MQTPGQTADHVLTHIEDPMSQTENEMLGQQLPLFYELRCPKADESYPEALERHEDQIQKLALKLSKQKIDSAVV